MVIRKIFLMMKWWIKLLDLFFSSVIEHINSAFFIVKRNINRLDILTKYIFSKVARLFFEDISENFIIIAIFANNASIINGPVLLNQYKLMLLLIEWMTNDGML